MTEEAKQAVNEYKRQWRRKLTEEAKQDINEYQRQWRRNNPDKVKQYNAEYWERKASNMLLSEMKKFIDGSTNQNV